MADTLEFEIFKALLYGILAALFIWLLKSCRLSNDEGLTDDLTYNIVVDEPRFHRYLDGFDRTYAQSIRNTLWPWGWPTNWFINQSKQGGEPVSKSEIKKIPVGEADAPPPAEPPPPPNPPC